MERRRHQQERRHPWFNREEQKLVFPPGSYVLRCTQVTGPLNQDLFRVSGPFMVIRNTNGTNYRLGELDGTPISGTVHSRWLQPYFMPEGGVPRENVSWPKSYTFNPLESKTPQTDT